MTVTLREIASALREDDVRAMAHTLGVPTPITLKALIAAFIQSARPRPPVDLSPSSGNVPANGIVLSWRDPGAAAYWHATWYGISIEVLPQGDPAKIDESSQETHVTIPGTYYDTLFQCYVTANNKYGSSSFAHVDFHTVSKDQKSSSPPPPAKATTYSAIEFYNCYNGISVYFYVADKTAGTAAQRYGPIPYAPIDGRCGPGFTKPTHVPLVSGHVYGWSVVNVDTGNDLWDGATSGGEGPAESIVYPPS